MRRFTILALAVAIGLGTAASPFASSSPDGSCSASRATRASSGPRARRRGAGALTGAGLRRPRRGGRPRRDRPRRLRRHVAGLRPRLRRGGARAPPRGGDMSALGALPGIAGDPHSAVHRLAPRTKFVGFTSVTVVAVAAGPSLWPVWAGCLLVLAGVAVVARVPGVVLARRAAVALPLVLLAAAALPFVRHGGAGFDVGPLALWRRACSRSPPSRPRRRSGRSAPSCSARPRRSPRRCAPSKGCTCRACSCSSPPTTHRFPPARRRRDAPHPHRAARTGLARPERRGGKNAPVRARRGHVVSSARTPEGSVHRAMLARGYEAGRSSPKAARIEEPAGCGTRTAAGSRRSPAWTCASPTASASPCSDPTAPARRRSCSTSTGCSPARATSSWPACAAGHGRRRELCARVGLVFQDPDDQLFMPTVGEDVAFGPRNLGLDGSRDRPTRDRRAPGGRDGRERGARPACALDGPAAPRRHRHRCSPWSRRCSCSTSRRRTSTRAAARAARRPRRRRRHDARRHARPALRGAALRPRGRARRPAASSPTGRAATSSQTRRCSPRTTSSCRSGSTSPGSRRWAA